MARTKADKKKAKRKVKQKERRQSQANFFRRDRFDYLFNEALWLRDTGQLDKAVSYLEKALRLAGSGSGHAILLNTHHLYFNSRCYLPYIFVFDVKMSAIGCGIN